MHTLSGEVSICPEICTSGRTHLMFFFPQSIPIPCSLNVVQRQVHSTLRWGRDNSRSDITRRIFPLLVAHNTNGSIQNSTVRA